MEYQVPVYVSDMVALIARLDVETVHWVGTSLGGLIGMTLAALPDSPVKKLVLNDVGPVVTASSIARIGAYVGKSPPFPTIEAAEAYLRTVSAPFGSHSDAEWRFLTEHVVRKNPDGSLRNALRPGRGRGVHRAAFGQRPGAVELLRQHPMSNDGLTRRALGSINS
jgi:pimeloyl-ACP methyl ester carboxylesterase